MFITFLIESLSFGLFSLIWFWVFVQLNQIIFLFEKKENQNPNIQAFKIKDILNNFPYKFVFIQGTFVGSLCFMFLEPIIPDNLNLIGFGVFDEFLNSFEFSGWLRMIFLIIISLFLFSHLLLIVFGFPILVCLTGIIVMVMKLK